MIPLQLSMSKGISPRFHRFDGLPQVGYAWPSFAQRGGRSMSRVVEQFERAKLYLAGGVSASTRVNRAVGHAMLFERAAGCRVWDLDGREYLDLCCSHG